MKWQIMRINAFNEMSRLLLLHNASVKREVVKKNEREDEYGQ